MGDTTHERIFDKLEEIGEKLAALGATCPAREKRLDAIDARLRSVEAVQNKAIGIVTVVSIVVGSIGAVVTTIIKKALSQ
jgi:ABC-type transporter Mla maintaining outer membrane lipid asymmetry permease subunit MlaE